MKSMRCPSCGREQPLAPICAGCGVLLHGGPTPTEAAEPTVGEPLIDPDDRGRLWRMVVAFGLLIVGLLFVAAVMRSKLDAPEIPKNVTERAEPAPPAKPVVAEPVRKTIEPPEPPPEPPPPPSAGGREFLAPARILEVVEGGAGRYLAARLASPPYLAVFDVQAETWKSIGFDGGAQARIAADARRLYVASTNPRHLWSWDLTTLERITAAPIEDSAPRQPTERAEAVRFIASLFGLRLTDIELDPPTPLRLFAAGSGAADRPLLLSLDDDLRLIDPATLQPVLRHETGSLEPTLRNVAMLPGTRVHASASGGVFTIWRARAPTVGWTLRVDGARLRTEPLPADAGYAVLDANGQRIYTALGTIERGQPPPPEARLAPGQLRLPGTGRHLIEVGPKPADPQAGGLRILDAAGATVLALPPLSEFKTPIVHDVVRPEQRFHLLEQLGKLATVPRSDDRIVIRDVALPPPT